MSAPIQRYDVRTMESGSTGESYPVFDQANDGKYVLYADHVRVTEAMEAERKQELLEVLEVAAAQQNAAVLAERERCAKVLETIAFLHGNDKWRERNALNEGAAALRHDPARG